MRACERLRVDNERAGEQLLALHTRKFIIISGGNNTFHYSKRERRRGIKGMANKLFRSYKLKLLYFVAKTIEIFCAFAQIPAVLILIF